MMNIRFYHILLVIALLLTGNLISHANEKTKKMLLVSIAEQMLFLTENGNIVDRYPISTSMYGTGNKKNTNKTPIGLHQIKYKIGHKAPLGQIFRATSNTGEIAKIHTDKTDLSEDLILTRIMWLDGLEEGVNKGGDNDSFKRHIYIHGTNEEGLIGSPASHGCIRMKNEDIVQLFEQVAHYDQVLIVE